MSQDRYEPLPAVTRLPALAWSRMGVPARALAVLVALAAVAVAVIMAPKIADTKSDNAARDREEAAAAKRARIRELRALMRPRTGAIAVAATPSPGIERLITADARARPDVKTVLRTECKPIKGGAGRYSCTAVTSDLPGGKVSRGGYIGIPYRARVSGRDVAWCRIAGSPGEGSNKGKPLVPIPAICGG